MADTLVDSTIVIDASNNHPRAIRYLDGLILSGEAITDAHVVAEVISVTRDSKEQAKLLRILKRFRLLHGNEADSESSLKYLARFHLSHDLDFDDCMIGSTALRLGIPVATINDRHFRLFKGLKVIRSY
jgi:predicted nucleic acid-binding protein